MKPYTLLLLGVWIGIVAGLSFIEAPLKFQAPGITTQLGLGIGRLVFEYSNNIQFLLLALLFILLTAIGEKLSRTLHVLLTGLFLVVLFQSFLLLPELDVRAVRIINLSSG